MEKRAVYCCRPPAFFEAIAGLLRRDEVKILSTRNRSIAEWSLLATSRIHDIVSDEIKHPTDFKTWCLEVLYKRGSERAVQAITVKSDLTILGGINNQCSSVRL